VEAAGGIEEKKAGSNIGKGREKDHDKEVVTADRRKRYEA